MRRTLIPHVLATGLILALIALVPAFTVSAADPDQAGIVVIDAKSLQGNLLNDPAKQEIAVCLPPSYSESQKRYPVVYVFHGFGNAYDPTFLWRAFEPMFSAGAAREFILVGVNGRNVYNGGFYVNSPVIGGWEDFTVKEVVAYVDSHYRTLAKPEARGVTGFSMGAFAALNLALRHPDVYGATLAACPGLLAPGGLREAFDSWDGVFLQAYGAAFAPDPSKPPYGKIPKFDGSSSDNKIIKAWESGYGDLETKIKAYKALRTPLRGIQIRMGLYDEYP